MANNFKGTKELERVRDAAPEMLAALQGLIDPLTGFVDDTICYKIGIEKTKAIELAIEKALYK